MNPAVAVLWINNQDFGKARWTPPPLAIKTTIFNKYATSYVTIFDRFVLFVVFFCNNFCLSTVHMISFNELMSAGLNSVVLCTAARRGRRRKQV